MVNTAYHSSKPLYNSRIINSYIKFLRKNYRNIDVNEIMHYAGMTPYEVADENHWLTQGQINAFHEKLSQLTFNVNIAREAGRYAASPEASSVMRQFFLGFVSPAKAYSMVGKASKNFTRSTTFETRELSPNKVEVTVTPKEGVKEEPFQCDNRTGLLEGLAMLFQGTPPRVEHPECVFRGGKSCRYIFAFERTLSSLLNKIRNYMALSFLPACLAISFFSPQLSATVLFPATIAILLLLTLIAGNRERAELRASLNTLQYSTDQLIEQMEVNYNNALMTNEIGQAITSQTSNRDVLSSVVQIFRKRLDYDRCMILLSDKKKKRLLFRAGYGYTEEQLKFLKQTAFHLDKSRSKGIFVICFREQKPFLINNVREIQHDLSIKSQLFANKLGSQAFICAPIIADGEPLGILAVDNLKSKKALVHSDMSLMIGLASVIGISIRNVELIQSREEQFSSILHALAASIDARDPMTSGHSERVTEFALGICNELRLPKEYREMIRVASLLHDYGKIGVPDNILKKPGKLTNAEYEIVKTHADKTRRILNQIRFEGVFSEVPAIAGSHHEKMDGSGYPLGLTGEEIPLGARIIAVADFFEAITARRHYRGPISLKRAFEMLKAESGVKFDPKVVSAFMRYISKAHAGEPVYRTAMLQTG